jgi:UDP-glucuronate decarboxylase
MHENDGRVVSNFILQALRGDDITIYGDGTNTRSFQFVHDLVDGLMALINGDSTGPINIGIALLLIFTMVASFVYIFI